MDQHQRTEEVAPDMSNPPERDGLDAGQATITRTPGPDAARAVVPASDRPPNLIGVPIPARDGNTRRAVISTYRENPHLPAAARYAVVRLVRLHRLTERLVHRLETDGIFTKEGEVKKAVGELVRLFAEARQLEAALGLTPITMAALGINLGRLKAMADGGGGREPDDDVLALERRIVARLNGERDV